jgi:hypothetical protein
MHIERSARCASAPSRPIAHVASDGTSALVVWDRLSFAAGERSAHSSLVER